MLSKLFKFPPILREIVPEIPQYFELMDLQPRRQTQTVVAEDRTADQLDHLLGGDGEQRFQTPADPVQVEQFVAVDSADGLGITHEQFGGLLLRPLPQPLLVDQLVQFGKEPGSNRSHALLEQFHDDLQHFFLRDVVGLSYSDLLPGEEMVGLSEQVEPAIGIQAGGEDFPQEGEGSAVETQYQGGDFPTAAALIALLLAQSHQFLQTLLRDGALLREGVGKQRPQQFLQNSVGFGSIVGQSLLPQQILRVDLPEEMRLHPSEHLTPLHQTVPGVAERQRVGQRIPRRPVLTLGLLGEFEGVDVGDEEVSLG